MVDQLSIVRQNDTTSLYSTLLNNAFDRALAFDGKVSPNTLALRGMSGKAYRLFINNLVGSIPGARYLEIGSWAGSTACAAMENNRVSALCIDNWSEWGGPKDEFFANISDIKTDTNNFQFIESDFRAVDFTKIGTFNIFLFDGPHEAQDQYDGLALPLPALDHEFILIVDDWNHPPSREGTIAAIEALGVKIKTSIEVRTTQDGSHATVAGENSDWHNGYFLSVLEKY